MNNENGKMLDDLVEDFCRRAQLYGCDAVQVLLSNITESGATQNKSHGRGNWYARQGLAHEFITMEDTRVGEYVKEAEFGDESE